MTNTIDKLNTLNTSNTTNELNKIINCYSKILPKSTFPWVMLTLAAAAQFFAWFGGPYLFPDGSMTKKILYSWGFAFIQLALLVPAINISVELLGYTESYLSLLFHAIGLTAFVVLNRFTLKSPFNKKHVIAFILMIIAVVIACRADK